MLLSLTGLTKPVFTRGMAETDSRVHEPGLVAIERDSWLAGQKIGSVSIVPMDLYLTELATGTRRTNMLHAYGIARVSRQSNRPNPCTHRLHDLARDDTSTRNVY